MNRRTFIIEKTHSDLEQIRTTYCVYENNESLSQYRTSNDGLMIVIKLKKGTSLPTIMNSLIEIIDKFFFMIDDNWKPY